MCGHQQPLVLQVVCMGDEYAQVNVRLSQDLLDRIKALVPELAKRPTYTGVRMSLSAVIRLALERGVASLIRKR